MGRNRAIGPVGTAARLLLGSALLGPYLLAVDPEASEVVMGAVILPAAVVALHAVVARRVARPIDLTGAVPKLGFIALLALMFTLDATRAEVATFIGLLLIISGIRGYAGCELTSAGNWILGRDDQVGCVLLGPLDSLDRGGAAG